MKESIDTVTTKIPKVPEDEKIGSIGWKYNIMGRIRKAVEVVGTGAYGSIVPATTTKGSVFYLQLNDNSLMPGHVALFPNNKQARIQSRPQGSGPYIYKFQAYPGDTFSWATWLGIVPGTKTIFAGHSMYGERSLRGYSTLYFPEAYINHHTIQRKGLDISGDANTDKIRVYQVQGYEGLGGFVYEGEAQIRAQFLLEDDFQKMCEELNSLRRFRETVRDALDAARG